MYVISDFCREVDVNCARVGYYAASSGNLLPTFRDDLLVPTSRVQSSWPLKMGPIGYLEKSMINYHYSLRNDWEDSWIVILSCKCLNCVMPPLSPLV